MTKEIIEAILYKSQNREYMEECLQICHVLNDTDRNWQPVEHTELFYAESFSNPYYLMIVDKQIHVYLIGEKDKGKTYNVLNIEGFNYEKLTLAKSAIIKHITDNLKDSQKQFLPSPLSQRILYINKQRDILETVENNMYIFNRVTGDDNILKRNSKWTVGYDIYSADQPEYTTSLSDILKECFIELEENEESDMT